MGFRRFFLILVGQAIDRLTGVFSDNDRRAEGNEAEVKELHDKIGELAVESNFFTMIKQMSPAKRKIMINWVRADLSLTMQGKLLKISQLSLYYTPVAGQLWDHIAPTSANL